MSGAEQVRRAKQRPSTVHLTRRQVDVLILVAGDLHTSEIAAALGVSVRTVDQHLATMMQRADVRTRAGLVARCYAAGILPHDAWPPVWSGRLVIMPPERS